MGGRSGPTRWASTKNQWGRKMHLKTEKRSNADQPFEGEPNSKNPCLSSGRSGKSNQSPQSIGNSPTDGRATPASNQSRAIGSPVATPTSPLTKGNMATQNAARTKLPPQTTHASKTFGPTIAQSINEWKRVAPYMTARWPFLRTAEKTWDLEHQLLTYNYYP